MNNSTRFAQLKNECQLKDSDIYLLELIPLIEMMWSDGLNQEPELNLLNKYTSELVARIVESADGEDVINTDQANDFLERFSGIKIEANG